jgi:bile acid:Na+ symporter, BASS family
MQEGFKWYGKPRRQKLMHTEELAEIVSSSDSGSSIAQSVIVRILRKYGYTAAIMAAVTVAMLFPEHFVQINGFRLQKLIVPLLQIIMIGVGCTINWRSLVRVLTMPKAVLIGVFCHYLIMPLVALTIAKLFRFPPEIAAGIVLVGCCPSGLASNVISLLAKANVPLSVTVTTISTLLAPLTTPLLMKLLGGGFVHIDAGSMILDMIKLVVLPVFAGVLFNRILGNKARVAMKAMPAVSMVGIALIIVIITAAGRDSLLHVGFKLLLAMFLHMAAGFSLGYLGAMLLRLPEEDCRTVSIEVGMQNGGLASGIAMQMGRVATMGLAAAVNGPVMNVTFSLLGTWWSNHPPRKANASPALDKVSA